MKQILISIFNQKKTAHILSGFVISKFKTNIHCLRPELLCFDIPAPDLSHC